MSLKRDDGGVVYLNGSEVFRSNMPEGVIGSQTRASLADDDGTAFIDELAARLPATRQERRRS
jgi:hypothetical protein